MSINLNLTDQPAFAKIFAVAESTDIAETMRNTVENSPWHREENTWVHTLMCLDYYIENLSKNRSAKQNLITLTCLLFHDFGKPEAEETLQKADGSGTYRRYAGHEKISANEFISAVKDYPELLSAMFDAGLTWEDIRSIKWMIENHLPYSLEKEEKRKTLRATLKATLQEDEQCFYDQLVSDANGRISDDHEAKLQKVHEWIEKFDAIPVVPRVKTATARPTLYVLHGVSGAGKSTWRKNFNEQRTEDAQALIACEDDWRIEYAKANMNPQQLNDMLMADDAPAYDMAWNFCHMNKDSKYDAFARKKYQDLLTWKRDIILDRTNQSRKNRKSWVDAARQARFNIVSVEFYMSVKESNERQQTRGDKFLPGYFVRKIVMNMETPWLGTEVDNYIIVNT